LRKNLTTQFIFFKLRLGIRTGLSVANCLAKARGKKDAYSKAAQGKAEYGKRHLPHDEVHVGVYGRMLFKDNKP